MKRSPKPSVAPVVPTTDKHGVRIENLNPHLAGLILAENPELKPSDHVSVKDVARYRVKQIESMLLEEHGELSQLDSEVAQSIADRGTISLNTQQAFEEKRTLGQSIADKIAAFGGSWTFILSFLGFLAIWITLNVLRASGVTFDPYPFILLNLILSCIAALQAPVIMMSQNRQEAKDRMRSESDYQINLKAELEIRLLHEKLDHALAKQLERINEIHTLQAGLLRDLLPREAVEKPKGRK